MFGLCRGSVASSCVRETVAALAARPAVPTRIAHDLQAESCILGLALSAANATCSLTPKNVI